jgi:hypothetical protein
MLGRDRSDAERETERELVAGIPSNPWALTEPIELDAGQQEAQEWIDDRVAGGEFTTYMLRNYATRHYDIEGEEVIRKVLAERDRAPGFCPAFPFTGADLPVSETVPLKGSDHMSAIDDVAVVTASPTLKWTDVELRFISDEALQIILNGQHQPKQNYAELGFEDGRTGTPSLAWQTLLELARCDGLLKVNRVPKKYSGDRVPKQYRDQAKRVEAIRRTLRNRFGIAENPLPLDKKENCYRAEFQITRAPVFDGYDG